MSKDETAPEFNAPICDRGCPPWEIPCRIGCEHVRALKGAAKWPAPPFSKPVESNRKLEEKTDGKDYPEPVAWLAEGYGYKRVCLEKEAAEKLARGGSLMPLYASPPAPTSETVATYQTRVHEWMMACFKDEIAFSRQERNHRFLEEALELVQAMGCTRREAEQLVAYTYDRPIGEPMQEVGGVMVCLAALCTAASIDMDTAGEAELARIWTKVEKIRAKHAAKPQFSPLPGPSRSVLPAPTSEAAVEAQMSRDERQAAWAALRMVADAVGELFGPAASIESEDASLLRGPEYHHFATGIVEALQRVRQKMEEAEREPVRWNMQAWRARVTALEAENARLKDDLAKMTGLATSFLCDEIDYMLVNKLGDPEQQHNIRWARELGITVFSHAALTADPAKLEGESQ